MRKSLLYLLGFALVCCVAVAVFTLPARWQIQHITPKLPDWAALYVALDDAVCPRQVLGEGIPKPWWYTTLKTLEDIDRTAQLRAWLGQLNQQPDVQVLPARDVTAMAAAGLLGWIRE
jgi:hypothetical protein